MRDQGTAVADSAASVSPQILCDHPDDVAEVRPQSDYRLHVRFVDGTEGTVDMSALIHSQTAGVFAALADPAHFAQARVEFGAVTWPGGLDLAPDAMYAALSESGEWILR